MSLIKVSWYVLWVKNMHFGSLSDPSQTPAMRGEAELRILDFKNTWSDFQNTTAAEWSEAELRLYNLKETSPPQSQSQAVVCVSTPRMYPRSGYFLVSILKQYFSLFDVYWGFRGLMMATILDAETAGSSLSVGAATPTNFGGWTILHPEFPLKAAMRA